MDKDYYDEPIPFGPVRELSPAEREEIECWERLRQEMPRLNNDVLDLYHHFVTQPNVDIELVDKHHPNYSNEHNMLRHALVTLINSKVQGFLPGQLAGQFAWQDTQGYLVHERLIKALNWLRSGGAIFDFEYAIKYAHMYCDMYTIDVRDKKLYEFSDHGEDPVTFVESMFKD